MKLASALSLFAAALILSSCLSPGATTGAPVLPAAGRAARTAGDLLYIPGGRDSKILTYPKAKLFATFGYGESALCSDEHGNVYMMTFQGVNVYAHGATTPFRTLKMPYDFPEDCSMDPTSGDLAVAVACLSCSTSLVIFRHARGTAKAYAAGLIGQHCGYDNQGNVFLSGDSGGSQFVELPKGSTTFTPISFSPAISADGHIQWDGHYLAIEDAGSQRVKPAIYQVTISGSTATVVGTTPLNGALNVFDGWIDGDRAIVPFIATYYGTTRVGYWKYPEGGNPERILTERKYRFHGADAVTVSVAPNRR